ncbi:MAG: glycosyltransferase WbuB [Deltaproteobacteria bacterium HGW-Deltaproteobacteria-20]|jgi:glycosyltransferase involved in cell wall biosynthesis|nr:MAG: glycosyltransferase WbuB [Deltaproteobacteria bacterium HGW-Deltaproteobacteria-20]
MKILVIHQYYLGKGEPGGSRFNELARLWTEAGHDVTVIAGTLNYTTGKVPAHCQGRWVTCEQDGRVRVLRCHVPSTYARSYAGRMWSFFAFTLSSMSAVTLAGRSDVVVATSPPLVTALTGAFAARWGRVPWIFEVRDLWPESAVTTGVLSRGSPLTHLLYRLEAFAYADCDKVNVLTPAFREDILQRGLALPDKIVFVPNGADPELFRPGPRDNEVRRELGWGDRFVVMYAGAHGRANALHQLVDAAEHLSNRPDILLACVGDGPERIALADEAKRRGLSNIVFHGSFPKSRMPELVNACDVGAAVLQNNPTFHTVYPNKVFDYMACARPVLLAIDGAARKLVCEEAGAGVFAEPEDGRAIAEAVRELEADAEGRVAMGDRGRTYVVANLSRDVLATKYLELIEGLVCSGPDWVGSRQG